MRLKKGWLMVVDIGGLQLTRVVFQCEIYDACMHDV